MRWTKDNPGLGHIRYKESKAIIRVLSADYPNCPDLSGQNKKIKLNSTYKYIREDLKVWLDNGNPMPQKNEVLFHLDNDYKNNNISNLYLMSRALMGSLNLKKRVVKDKNINKSNILLTRLEFLVRKGKKNECRI